MTVPVTVSTAVPPMAQSERPENRTRPRQQNWRPHLARCPQRAINHRAQCSRRSYRRTRAAKPSALKQNTPTSGGLAPSSRSAFTTRNQSPSAM